MDKATGGGGRNKFSQKGNVTEEKSNPECEKGRRARFRKRMEFPQTRKRRQHYQRAQGKKTTKKRLVDRLNRWGYGKDRFPSLCSGTKADSLGGQLPLPDKRKKGPLKRKEGGKKKLPEKRCWHAWEGKGASKGMSKQTAWSRWGTGRREKGFRTGWCEGWVLTRGTVKRAREEKERIP